MPARSNVDVTNPLPPTSCPALANRSGCATDETAPRCTATGFRSSSYRHRGHVRPLEFGLMYHSPGPQGCPEAATPEPQAATTHAPSDLPHTHPGPTRSGGCPSPGNRVVCRRCVLRSSTFRLPAAHHRGSNRRDTGYRGSPRYARLAPWPSPSSRGWLPAGEISCPQSDSNRHFADFKSAASANWAIGAPGQRTDSYCRTEILLGRLCLPR